MSLKKYQPTTPGTRHMILVDKSSLYKGKPCKKLTKGISKTGGRNNRGVITSRARGGGCKRKYRSVDFAIHSLHGNATIKNIEYDPNRSAFIALIEFEGGVLKYIVANNKMKVGDVIECGIEASIAEGNIMPLGQIPVGFLVYSVEINPGGGAKLARAAGSYASIVAKEGGKVLVKLKSKQNYLLSEECYAIIGVVSNLDNKNISWGKAGKQRLLNRRPSVRGVAMNPIDHPHGGGEGKAGTSGAPVTPWGKITKGKKTRKKYASNRRTSL